MCKEHEERMIALEKENQHLRVLIQAECERLFRYVPLSCGLNAAIMDDWFTLATELEALDLFPDKPGRKEPT